MTEDLSTRNPTPRHLLALITLVVLLGTGTVVFLSTRPDLAVEAIPHVRVEGFELFEKSEEFYNSRPPYERPRAASPTPDGLGDTDAETCGACHKAIYQEWRLSTHHRAYTDDAQFMEELDKSRGHGAPGARDVSWLCVNCHTPTIPQLERLVVALEQGEVDRPVYVENPLFDAEIQQDAITCAACHVRQGKVYGPFGDTRAPHPTARADDLLDERICATCHQAEARYPTQNLGCFFSTVEEWRASPYPAQGQTCQGCHMPTVTRKLAEDFDVPVRQTRRHWFGGSLIPKKPEFAAELEPLQRVYGDGLELALEPRGAVEEFRPDISPSNMPEGSQPHLMACTNDCVIVALTLTNANAGHHLPTGDPERHIEVLLEAIDGHGEVVSRVYTALGSRYAWWPAIELIRDTRLPAKAQRTLLMSVPRDSLPVTLHLTADKQRMYREAFAHHALEGKYVRGRRFYDARFLLTSPDTLTAAP